MKNSCDYDSVTSWLFKPYRKLFKIHFCLFFSSQKLLWDYHAEVQAFSNRLHENFPVEILKRAFINPCYIHSEQERREKLGMDSETTALVLKDNIQLSEKGADFTKSFLTDWCRVNFPNLPSEGVESIVVHLNSLEVVTYVARNLGIEDLTMSADFPVPDAVMYSTFMAVIGVLQESSGSERAGFFLRVGVSVCCDKHLIPTLNGLSNILISISCRIS